jgi:hypothetical protein
MDLNNNNSIFQSSWWLEAVAPGQWGEVLVEKGGQVVGRLPYVKKKKFGFTFLIMPQLTQTLGTWLSPKAGKYSSQISEQRELTAGLIDQLPPFDFFWQNLHYSVTDCLPFYWRGYQQTTRYTYVLEDLSDLDKIWQEIKNQTRNRIRKAESSGIKVVESEDIDGFLGLVELTYKRQGLALPYSQELVKRIDEACKKRSARKIFLAFDQQGVLHSGTYLVYDSKTAYNLISGSDPESRNIGAGMLAIWESIKFAASQSRVYDFEGSMIESIEKVFRHFGAKQRPYLDIRKINSRFLRIAYDMSNWLGVDKKAKRMVER